MTKKRIRLIAGAFGITFLGTFAAGVLTAASTHDVTRPGTDSAVIEGDWVREDGTVDEELAPEIVPVVGTDGKPVVRDGVEMGIRMDDLHSERAAKLMDTAAAKRGGDEDAQLPVAEALDSLLVPMR